MLVSRSLSTKPSWMVHWPAWSRWIWRLRISSISWSMVSSRGSTRRAVSMSAAWKLRMVRSRMSSSAESSTCSSSRALSENRSSLSWSSWADSWMFTAWSPIRSKSPMAWSKRETVRISCMDSPCWEISTR